MLQCYVSHYAPSANTAGYVNKYAGGGKAKSCYKSQSRQLINEGEKKLFSSSYGLISTMRLYPLPLAVHIATAHKWIWHTMCPLPSIFLDPPLGTVHVRITSFLIIYFLLWRNANSLNIDVDWLYYMKYISSNTDSQCSDCSTSAVQPVDLVMHNKMFLHKLENTPEP